MTDAELTGLELRRAVAEKLGWREIHNPGRLVGICPGREDEGFIPIRPYEASADACLRDVVPWARERGYQIRIQSWPKGEWSATFVSIDEYDYTEDDSYPPSEGATASEAVCRAVLKLPQPGLDRPLETPDELNRRFNGVGLEPEPGE